MSFTPEQQASDETTSIAQLRELAGQNTALARLVAGNFSADSELLRALAAHDDRVVRQLVTANPNVPLDLLERLAKQHPIQALNNPAIDLFLLENPSLLSGLSLKDLPVSGLIKRSLVSSKFLEYAARLSDEKVQMAIAMHPQTPVEILNQLTASQNVHIVEAAKMHISLSESNNNWRSLFQKRRSILLFEEGESLKAALDKFKGKQNLYWTQDFPEWIERREREEREEKTREESKYSLFNQYMLLILILMSFSIVFFLLIARGLIASIGILLISVKEMIRILFFQVLYKREDVDQSRPFRMRLKRLLEKTIKGLRNASEPVEFVHTAWLKNVARNPKITADALKQLLCLKRHDISEVAISHPSIIQFIAEEWDLETLNLFENYYLRLIAKRPDTPAGVLKKLVQHEVWTVRDLAVNHPNANRKVIEQWQKSSSYSDQELEWLLRHEDEWFQEWLKLSIVTRLTILTHPEVPIGILAQAFRRRRERQWW